jgi:hypothetical protein
MWPAAGLEHVPHLLPAWLPPAVPAGFQAVIHVGGAAALAVAVLSATRAPAGGLPLAAAMGAVAAGLAQGLSLRDSVIRARAYVRAAIAAAPGFGAGHGPLNHAVTCDPGILR